jgi:hypothetical protein
MDRFELKMFFHDVLILSYNDLKPGWGNPCSHLLQTFCLRKGPFLDGIIGDYTGNSHEYRLNNAGVKMYWEVWRHDDRAEFRCSIGGDQAKEYPLFIEQVRSLIKKYGFSKHRGISKWKDLR